MLMGDFNGRLARNIKGRTCQFTPHRQTDENGQLLLDLMLRHDLRSALSYCHPAVVKRPNGQRRKKVREWEKRRAQRGYAADTDPKPRLMHHHPGNATYIMEKDQAKAASGTGKAPAQIDHMLVSTRWASSVDDCSVGWANNHNKSGIKRDHGMIKMLWRMRLATAKPKRKRRHVSQLKTDEQVHAANENAVAATLNVEPSDHRFPANAIQGEATAAFVKTMAEYQWFFWITSQCTPALPCRNACCFCGVGMWTPGIGRVGASGS